MKHTSIPLNGSCELIHVTPINPLISKCQIKVCYVGENRNGSYITREVAADLANSLPGSPIVGYYNEEKKDFEEHNREIEVKDGELRFIDTTRPYGFVDLGAKVWFETFLDDGITEHEYLMTEGYLWTGQYPETQRIIDKGNNQSMELDEKSINGHWSEINNDGREFFIINEAIISKLCILGEDFEPCFEGSRISKVQFSFDDKFKNDLYALMEQMKEILDEGGLTQMDTEVIETTTEEVIDTPAVEEPEVEEVETEVIEEPTEDSETEEDADIEEEPVDDQETEEDTNVEEGTEETKEEITEEVEDEIVEYNLEENQEYIELRNNYSQLESDYNEVVSQNGALEAELATLREFKKTVDRAEKQKMIESFSMLTAEDKLDVITKIDEYSLDEIEAKLSVICVRTGKVGGVKSQEPTSYSYNIDSADYSDDTPEWVKAVKAVQQNM